MAETRTSTSRGRVRLESDCGRGETNPDEDEVFSPSGPPESFSFFDRTRTPQEHLEDLPGNEELVKIKVLTLCALFAECSCRTQESPPAFKDTRTRNFALPAQAAFGGT
jgi:hypothetical protein